MGFFEFLFRPQPKPAKAPASPADRGSSPAPEQPQAQGPIPAQEPPRIQRAPLPAGRAKPRQEARLPGPFDQFVAAGLRAIRFIDKKGYRKALAGVLYRKGHIIATDGHRLLKERVPIPAHLDEVIIPPELFVAHRHVPIKTLSLTRDRKSLMVNGQPCRLIVGEKYPDTDSVTPTVFKFQITFDRLPVEDALRLAGESKQAVFTTMMGNRLRMTVNQTVPPTVIPFKGKVENTEFAFNPAFLLGVLRSLEGDNVTMKGNSPLSAFVFQGEQPERTALLMPVRITAEEMRAAA